jgi:hypothetical protein
MAKALVRGTDAAMARVPEPCHSGRSFTDSCFRIVQCIFGSLARLYVRYDQVVTAHNAAGCRMQRTP